MALNWILAGGGTGGHVTTALALGESLRERGENVLFLGSERGLENRLVPDAGFELVSLPSQQVMGRSLLGRLQGVWSNLAAACSARAAVRRFRADAVISVGGFAAVPAILAAIWTRTPLAIVEPNAIPGRVNRLSARFARLVFTGFEVAARRLGKGDKSRCFGVPLRRDLIRAFPEAAQRRVPKPPFRLLVFGGSQGAHQINEAMVDAAPRLPDLAVEVFHASGEADRERVAAAYAKAGVEAQVVDFEPDLPHRYRWADLAICRSGALTVAELALAALPSLLVPYPYAADDHQAANAEELERVGAAQRLRGLEDEAERGAIVADSIAALLADPNRLPQMSEAALLVARPQAADAIVDCCLETLISSEART